MYSKKSFIVYLCGRTILHIEHLDASLSSRVRLWTGRLPQLALLPRLIYV